MNQEFRFIERSTDKGESGWCERVLQWRNGPCYPWVDVPVYTLEMQRLEHTLALDDSTVADYK